MGYTKDFCKISNLAFFLLYFSFKSMTFLITAITKVERDSYNDIIWAGGKVIEVRPAPVEAFFDIETLTGDEIVVFEAEVRQGKLLSVDWSDEFDDLLVEHSKSKEDWGLITVAIFNVYKNEVVNFPIKIGVS
jgi:hypothetical protein